MCVSPEAKPLSMRLRGGSEDDVTVGSELKNSADVNKMVSHESFHAFVLISGRSCMRDKVGKMHDRNKRLNTRREYFHVHI